MVKVHPAKGSKKIKNISLCIPSQATAHIKPPKIKTPLRNYLVKLLSTSKWIEGLLNWPANQMNSSPKTKMKMRKIKCMKIANRSAKAVH